MLPDILFYSNTVFDSFVQTFTLRERIERKFKACLTSRNTAETDKEYAAREAALDQALTELHDAKLDRAIARKGETAKRIVFFELKILGTHSPQSPHSSPLKKKHKRRRRSSTTVCINYFLFGSFCFANFPTG